MREIQEYTKDAIYRQMQEYKRSCSAMETRLEELQRRGIHHDDHLRVVDAWWIQLLQELALIVDRQVPYGGEDEQPFPTQTSFKDNDELQAHLGEKRAKITSAVESIIGRIASARGDSNSAITKLESQVNSLLASQKEFRIKLDRYSTEKDDTSEQLNTATLRYMKAERKLDRVKSTQVQKLEQQALASATTRPTVVENGNGSGDSNGNTEALQLALREAKVENEKQKAQLDAALAQNKSLQEELTALQTRLTSLTDEDYARTEVFKLFRSHQEDLIKKVNHLDTENKKLQEQNYKLMLERETYKKKLEEEAEALKEELEDQLHNAESTLVRIRSARDELYGEVTMLKASRDQEKISLSQMKELLSAKEDRINALELELQRLQPSEDVDMTDRPDIDNLTMEELRDKYRKLQKDFASINKELPAMTAAVKKYQALATKKIMDLASMEERVTQAIADKGKANQKYFDARKNSDTHLDEIKKLRAQNSKSSEIISQLKDNEAHHRTLLGNLEKQLLDLKQTNTTTMAEGKRLESSSNDALKRHESLKAQVLELSGLAKSKDATAAQARERAAALETENEKMKLRLDQASKDRDKWKVKSMSNSSEEEELLRVSPAVHIAPAISLQDADGLHRNWRLARYAKTGSKTRYSRTAGTSSAKSASTTESPTVCGNAPTAAGPLTVVTS